MFAQLLFQLSELAVLKLSRAIQVVLALGLLDRHFCLLDLFANRSNLLNRFLFGRPLSFELVGVCSVIRKFLLEFLESPARSRVGFFLQRFSLDLEPMGLVHALVTLAGGRASVTLWAERISTASKLNDNVALLGDALRAAELQPSELSFRVGTPRAAKAAAPGRFMDRAS